MQQAVTVMTYPVKETGEAATGTDGTTEFDISGFNEFADHAYFKREFMPFSKLLNYILLTCNAILICCGCCLKYPSARISGQDLRAQKNNK